MITHHAIVCIADALEVSLVPKKYQIQSEDVTHIILDRFSIADARQLSIDALQKPINSEYRVFVLVVKKITIESQNALLKLFEEPPIQTRFYLVIPQEGILIPTLRSRVCVEAIKGIKNIDYTKNDTFCTFLSDTYANRLTTILRITKNKDLISIEDIIRGVEMYVATGSIQHAELLSSILFIREYIKTPGASAKMLLEEIALSLPVVK